MVIFVDGFQNTGKTTLVDACKYRHNRFPFNQYLDMFNLGKEALSGFQLAKDLAMMFGLQYSKENLVLDRGPLSTVFYSLKENRYGPATNEMMVKFLKEVNSFKGFRYVFVTKKNAADSFLRNHADGFDYLDDDNDANKDALLWSIADQAASLGMKISFFENDFSRKLKQSIHDFNDLLERLMHEHD